MFGKKKKGEAPKSLKQSDEPEEKKSQYPSEDSNESDSSEPTKPVKLEESKLEPTANKNADPFADENFSEPTKEDDEQVDSKEVDAKREASTPPKDEQPSDEKELSKTDKKKFLEAIISSQEEIYIPPGMNLNTIKSTDPILEIIHPLVMDEVNITNIAKMTTEAIVSYIRPVIRRVLEEQKITLTIDEQEYFENRMIADITGYGVLDFFLADDSVSDILINGCSSIYCERFGRLERSAVTFRDNEQLMNVVTKIVSAVGRRCDETIPYVDARMYDGSRFNAIIPPLAIDGPSLSIRKFKEDKIRFQDMIKFGSLTEEMAKLLSAATQSRLNILVVGGTGSGKTTMLNALSSMINPRERVITIEDAAELQLQQPHVVRLETRNPNIEGKGAIDQRQLVSNALRMRPDRVILGEIRGAEAFDMIQAMNTGHDGSMCTIHASSPREVPARLSNMVMMSGYDFPAKAVLQQIASSVNLLVQVSRQRDGKRRVTEITEVVGLEGEIISMQDLYTFVYEREDAMGNIVGSFQNSEIMPHFYSKAEMAGVDHLLKEIYHG